MIDNGSVRAPAITVTGPWQGGAEQPATAPGGQPPGGTAAGLLAATPLTRIEPRVLGGGVTAGGALLGLVSAVLPWLSVNLVVVESSLSLTQIVALADDHGKTDSAILFTAMIAGLVLSAMLGLASGATCVLARGLPARIAAIVAIVAGALVLAIGSLFVLMVETAGDWSLMADLGVGVFAAGFGALLMIGGGGAALVADLVRRPGGAGRLGFGLAAAAGTMPTRP